MKSHYASVASYASKKEKKALSDGIDASQRGNESQFKDDITEYPVPLERVEKIIELIGLAETCKAA